MKDNFEKHSFYELVLSYVLDRDSSCSLISNSAEAISCYFFYWIEI